MQHAHACHTAPPAQRRPARPRRQVAAALALRARVHYAAANSCGTAGGAAPALALPWPCPGPPWPIPGPALAPASR